jgi:hypothetical protein
LTTASSAASETFAFLGFVRYGEQEEASDAEGRFFTRPQRS